MLFSAISGLLAGSLHVLAGPDHLTAIAPFSVSDTSGTQSNSRKSWLPGFRWGLGHTGGIAVVGILALALRDLLPLQELSRWSEKAVGISLIAIALWAARKAGSKKLHAHVHGHGEEGHIHFHAHGSKQNIESAHPVVLIHDDAPHRHSHAAFFVGTLHGLAGSAHFYGILPALAFSDQASAITYLGFFGVGSLITMTGFSTMLGWFSRRFSFHGVQPYRTLMGGCAALALGVGLYWLTI